MAIKGERIGDEVGDIGKVSYVGSLGRSEGLLFYRTNKGYYCRVLS